VRRSRSTICAPSGKPGLVRVFAGRTESMQTKSAQYGRFMGVYHVANCCRQRLSPSAVAKCISRSRSDSPWRERGTAATFFSGLVRTTFGLSFDPPPAALRSPLIRLIAGSHALNRSLSPTVACFFGRIVPSDAPPNHCSSQKGIAKNQIASFRHLKPRNLAISNPPRSGKSSRNQSLKPSSRATT
jgi:hypothetical protein